MDQTIILILCLASLLDYLIGNSWGLSLVFVPLAIAYNVSSTLYSMVGLAKYRKQMKRKSWNIYKRIRALAYLQFNSVSDIYDYHPQELVILWGFFIWIYRSIKVIKVHKWIWVATINNRKKNKRQKNVSSSIFERDEKWKDY